MTYCPLQNDASGQNRAATNDDCHCGWICWLFFHIHFSQNGEKCPKAKVTSSSVLFISKTHSNHQVALCSCQSADQLINQSVKWIIVLAIEGNISSQLHCRMLRLEGCVFSCKGAFSFTLHQGPSATLVCVGGEKAWQGRMPAHTAMGRAHTLTIQHHLSHSGNWWAQGVQRCMLSFICRGDE